MKIAILIFAVGFCVGMLVNEVITLIKYKNLGTLNVDSSNPEKEIYRMDLNDIPNLGKKKKVMLKIEHADLSQK